MSDDEPSELAVSDEGSSEIAREGTESGAPHVAQVTAPMGSGEASDLEQYAATVAARHLDAAIASMVDVMQNPNRNARYKLEASKELVALALRRTPGRAHGEQRIYVLDRGQASAELVKRLGLRE